MNINRIILSLVFFAASTTTAEVARIEVERSRELPMERLTGWPEPTKLRWKNPLHGRPSKQRQRNNLRYRERTHQRLGVGRVLSRLLFN
ncbi:MAG: hypothetical protein CM1200mP36_09200 [Gammaproteobacteria bacterium]|nr:MAG: hypothetical protein CM1200mP36_09200 [Gammaproteobacteria bacterium]